MEDLAGGSYGAAKTFRSQMGFSQPGAIFAAHFAAAKWGWAAVKWHSCAKGVFRSCETPCEMGLWLRKLEISHFAGFAAISQLRNGVTVLRNGTRVPKGGFAAAKIFAEGCVGLRNHFAEEGYFRRGLFLAAKFRRPLNFYAFELLCFLCFTSISIFASIVPA
ncbi:hypothetical protein VitviT2T_002533 [Vitis vinifera]|uniref:Uncharacterized protein n=1 Tax=Vitis vinifera TaxID=29760 RepID=A0ABY9BJZ4_VITVI|nr:hypothetical protein VitviT2T_002533 [Vitis vinifera]